MIDKDAFWSAFVGDYDQDGDLDIAASGGTQSASTLLGPLRILNNDYGVYSDVASLLVGSELLLESWGIRWIDYDNDGDLDLWVPTIRAPGEINALLINNQSEFEYGSYDAFIADSLNDAIVSGWADYDNDGDMDLYAIPFNSTAGVSYNKSQFWRNNGDGTLTDIAPDLGLTTPFGSRCFCWGDYDNDGDQDLLIGMRTGAQFLYRNDDGQFTDVAAEVGLTTTDGVHRGAHLVDYDNDGFLDVYLARGDNDVKYLLHNSGNSNHWIVIKPKGVTDNTAAIGARVRVVAGSLRMIRDIEGSGPGLASGKLWAHFGLGSATVADSAIVRWPNGDVEVATNVAADKYYSFTQGSGISTGVNNRPDNSAAPADFKLAQNYPNPFNPATTIQFTLPVRSEVRLVLVNTIGEVVKEIISGTYAAGQHQVRLDASELSSGIYFYKLEAGGSVEVKKLVLMK